MSAVCVFRECWFDDAGDAAWLLRLREGGIDLRLTEAAKQALVREGYDPTYGARPLGRVIQR